jgi:hypothetical protein
MSSPMVVTHTRAATVGAVQPALQSAQDQRHENEEAKQDDGEFQITHRRKVSFATVGSDDYHSRHGLPDSIGSLRVDRTAPSRHLDLIGPAVGTTLTGEPRHLRTARPAGDRR